MLELLIENWIGVIFSLISGGLLAFCRYLYKKNQQYEKLIQEEKQEELEKLIAKTISPLEKQVQDTQEYAKEAKKLYEAHLDLIIRSYKFRLIQLCKNYLEQGYMTTEQYEQLSEMYSIYKGLGGNSQAKDYYIQATKLQIKDV